MNIFYISLCKCKRDEPSFSRLVHVSCSIVPNAFDTSFKWSQLPSKTNFFHNLTPLKDVEVKAWLGGLFCTFWRACILHLLKVLQLSKLLNKKFYNYPLCLSLIILIGRLIDITKHVIDQKNQCKRLKISMWDEKKWWIMMVFY